MRCPSRCPEKGAPCELREGHAGWHAAVLVPPAKGWEWRWNDEGGWLRWPENQGVFPRAQKEKK